MTSKIEEQIKQKEEEIQALFDKMESQRQAFVGAATTTILGWYAEKAEEIVVSKPEITKAVGAEALQDLKRRIAQLQEDAAPIRELLEDDRLWWHKKHADQVYSYYGNRAPETLDKPVRRAAGRLAAALERHGYLPTDHHDHNVWREWDSSGNRHPLDAKPYYVYGFPWSGEMQAAIKAYEELHLQAELETSDLTRLQAQKETGEAKAIWDKA